MKEPLKVYEAFAGKGTFSEAFTDLNILHEIVGYCKIDPYASTAFTAIHNISEDLNGWDITKVNPNTLPDFDVFTHGSPCTSFSMAGKRDGADKNSGTQSSLIWYSVEIIKNKKPKYVLWENVSDVLSNKHIHNFEEYINELANIGYNSYFKVLIATDFGIPQKRKRIYVVSIRNDIDKGDFYFPLNNNDIKLSLKDVLEKDVDNKYYVSERCLNGIKNSEFVQKANQIQDIEKPCATILARDYKDPKIVIDKKGYRKLSPLEYFRLMDESDENFYKIKEALIHKFYNGKDRADSQLYKIAGNSIVKRVLVEYYKILFKDYMKQ